MGLRNCFISCLYAKKVHSRPCMTGFHHCSSSWDVPKSTKALQDIWTTNLWGKLDEDGLKNLCVLYMDQANLALLPCLHTVITWLVSQEKGQAVACLARVKLALMVSILKGLAPLALHTDVCSEGRGNLNLERLIISLVFCPSADCSSGRGVLLLDYICMHMNGHK